LAGFVVKQLLRKHLATQLRQCDWTRLSGHSVGSR